MGEVGVPKFRDRQMVRLKRDIPSEEGGMMPAGSIGVVVRVHPDDVTYEVKFTDVRNIHSIGADDLEQPD
jgi:hypothetical protein